MKENVTLLQEINELRTEVKSLRKKLKLLGAYNSDYKLGSTGRSQLENSMRSKPEKEGPLNEIQKESKMQDITIEELNRKI